MTAETRFERELPALLEDLYLGPSPEYRNEVMAVALRSRQRPSWTFAGRWFPMADIATSTVSAPRVPWRAAGLALLVIALIVAAAALIAGSTQNRVPPPFGPARNGVITYASKGDIYTIDPATGTTAAIVTGPTVDSDPVFSPDGTRIAFRQANPLNGSPAEDLVVVGPDGSKPVVITANPIPAGPSRFEWAPDSRSLLVGVNDDSAIWLYDVSAAAPPRKVTTNAQPYFRPFQPPTGSAFLAWRRADGHGHILLIDLETGRERGLAEGNENEDFGAVRWSPDGSQIVFNSSPAHDGGMQRLFLMNADGSGVRPIADAPGVRTDIDGTWSPDGKSIAFTRYEQDNGAWDILPVRIYSVATGDVTEAGPLPRDVRAKQPSAADAIASRGEGFYLEWSPDSKSLIAFPSEASGHAVVINPSDGTWRVLDQVSDPGLPAQAWQRKAP